MRTKLLSAALLASTALAGVASASPIVRDHRYHRPQPVFTHRTRASWTNYGYQLDADGDEVTPYRYGSDPYAENIARAEWSTLNPCIDVSGDGSVRQDLGYRPLQSIELQATRGGAYVYAVDVTFDDGSQRSIRVDRDLDVTHAPNLRLDLGAEGLRGVQNVVLETTGTASIRMLGA